MFSKSSHVKLYCSCHAAQASKGNFQKICCETFGTSGRPTTQYIMPPLQVPESLLNKLLLPKVSRMCNDLCFERAALNVLALSCVFREKDFDYDT